jgi:CRP/FNR family transcriptional regulator, dissimilatory nitrate respiration regulator
VQELVPSDIPLFAAVSKKTTNTILRSVRMIDARRGTVLFRSGDAPSGIRIIVSGVVKLSLPHAPRGEKVIALLRPGESFGLSALLSDTPHVVTAAVARDCTIAHLPRTSALRLMRDEPKFLHQIAIELSRRFRDLLLDIKTTTRQSAIQRIVVFLVAQLPRARSNQAVTLRLPAKKADIASKLDLTGAHFSRILHELDSSGVIDLNGSTVTVPDSAKLRAMVARAGVASQSAHARVKRPSERRRQRARKRRGPAPYR